MAPKVAAIVQARLGSSRLPGKVLLPIGPFRVVEHIARRLGRAKCVDEVLFAVPDGPLDEPLRCALREMGAWVHAGSEDDVLSRYAGAARKTKAAHIVRITSDCPCLDPGLIDQIVMAHLSSGADYTSNTLTRTCARGFDVEVVRADRLLGIDRLNLAPEEREHVTPRFYRRPEEYRLCSVPPAGDFGDPAWRLCLDTREDYALLCRLWEVAHDEAGDFLDARGLVSALHAHASMLALNESIIQKAI